MAEGRPMAQDKRKEEEFNQLKSLATSLLEALMEVAPVPDSAKQVYSLSKETIKVLEFKSNADSTGWTKIQAFDDNLNKLEEISLRLYDELGLIVGNDENWWIYTSGANLFSVGDSTKAVEFLQKQSGHFQKVRKAISGLKVLTGVVYASSVADVKGLAKLFTPSVPMIDAAVSKRIIENFDDCSNRVDTIIKRIDKAAQVVADMNKAVDRFKILVNSQDQRDALKAIEAGRSKTAIR